MKTGLNRFLAQMPVALLAAFCSGCATPALWRHTATHDWNPMSVDHMLLFTNLTQPPEVVVLFNQSAKDGKTYDIRAVGWRISRPAEELAITPHAIYQLTNSLGNMRDIRICNPAELPENISASWSDYAVLDWTGRQLTLHVAGVPSGPYTLPATRQKANLGLRACVMPIAIATDAAITGAVIFIIGAGGYH